MYINVHFKTVKFMFKNDLSVTINIIVIYYYKLLLSMVK